MVRKGRKVRDFRSRLCEKRGGIKASCILKAAHVEPVRKIVIVKKKSLGTLEVKAKLEQKQ